MATLQDLLNSNKLNLNYQSFQKPSILELIKQQNAQNTYNPQPAPQSSVANFMPQQALIQQQAMPQPQARDLGAEVEQSYLESLAPKKQSKIGEFMTKYGLTPGVITQIAGGLTALTGGNPYVASGIAQAGGDLRKLESQEGIEKEKQKADYVKQRMAQRNKIKGLGQGIVTIDKDSGKGYLPTTDENGEFVMQEVNPNEYITQGYTPVYKHKSEMDIDTKIQNTKQLGAVKNQIALDKETLLSPIKTTTAVNTKKGTEDVEIGNIGRKEGEKSKSIEGKISEAEAGRYVLANTSKKEVAEARDILFPKGTAESFDRGIAAKSNLPITGGAMPFDEKAQKVYSRLSSAVAAKLLLQTGVAANPDEVKRIVSSYITDWKSDPKAGFEQLNRLENFYDDYTKLISNKKIQSNSEQNKTTNNTNKKSSKYEVVGIR
jgi:glutaredoxin 2